MSTLFNIVRQAIRPSRFKVMAKKAMRRLESRNVDENLRWLERHAVRFEETLGAAAPDLWREAVAVSADIDRVAKAKLDTLPVVLGGGGATPYLYYLTRLIIPEVVVETGVAAGYSSQAILAALERNGVGQLYSSDFPYFRISNPEKYIGCVVDDYLKSRWTLLIDGDDANLRVISSMVAKIDLFHYDSDKTYAGRKSAMKQVRPLLSADAFVLMDDIQDNSYFRDLVREMDAANWRVFRYSNKFVGILGPLGKLGVRQ